MKKEEVRITKKNIFDAKSLIQKNLEKMQNQTPEEKSQASEKEEKIVIIKI